jgi:hypothetical protein
MRTVFLIPVIIFSALLLCCGCGRKSPQPGDRAGAGTPNPDSTLIPAATAKADSLRGPGVGPNVAQEKFPLEGRPSALMDTTLASGRAGALRMRIPVDSVYVAYGRSRIRETDLQLEGTPSPALEITLPGGTEDNPSLVAEIDENRNVIFRIQVYDSRFRTDKGIGPGATLQELEKRYRVDEIAQGEGNTVAIVRSLGMSFVLDPSAIPREFYRTGNPKLIPGSARIVKILIFA